MFWRQAKNLSAKQNRMTNHISDELKSQWRVAVLLRFFLYYGKSSCRPDQQLCPTPQVNWGRSWIISTINNIILSIAPILGFRESCSTINSRSSKLFSKVSNAAILSLLREALRAPVTQYYFLSHYTLFAILVMLVSLDWSHVWRSSLLTKTQPSG